LRRSNLNGISTDLIKCSHHSIKEHFEFGAWGKDIIRSWKLTSLLLPSNSQPPLGVISMKLRYLPIILAAVFLAAHFLRSYSLVPLMLCLVAPFLLLIKKRWSLVTLQLLTVPAALIWLITLYAIIQERIFEQRSWTASAIILGVVTLFTPWAGWLLNSARLKEHYPS
jgi:hypothetical protein